MSAEDTEPAGPAADRPVSWYEAPASLLEAPLVGLERRRTVAVLGYLLAFVALFGVSYAGTAVTIDGSPLDTTTRYFDVASMVLIALATATIAIVPLLYAVWNGGPALSFAVALVPVFLGEAATGRYVLDLDVAIALTVGATASALVLLAVDVRTRASLRPWRYRTVDRRRLTIVTALVGVAAVGVAQFVRAAPGYVLEWYAPFSVLWLPAGAIVCSYWYARWRTPTGVTARERADA